MWFKWDIFQSEFFLSMPFLNFMNFISTLARLAGVFIFSAGFTGLLRAARLRRSASSSPMVCSVWYFSKAEKALLANSAMGANVSRFLWDEQRSNGFMTESKFSKFSLPCAGGRSHGAQCLNDRCSLLPQVLADVEDHGEGDEDDHDAEGKPGSVEMILRGLWKERWGWLWDGSKRLRVESDFAIDLIQFILK